MRNGKKERKVTEIFSMFCVTCMVCVCVCNEHSAWTTYFEWFLIYVNTKLETTRAIQQNYASKKKQSVSKERETEHKKTYNKTEYILYIFIAIIRICLTFFEGWNETRTLKQQNQIGPFIDSSAYILVQTHTRTLLCSLCIRIHTHCTNTERTCDSGIFFSLPVSFSLCALVRTEINVRKIVRVRIQCVLYIHT